MEKKIRRDKMKVKVDRMEKKVIVKIGHEEEEMTFDRFFEWSHQTALKIARSHRA